MPGTRQFCFGPYTLDPSRRLLTRGSEPVPLTSRAFDVLLALVERSGETVDKDALLRRVWPDTVVEEANLSQQIFTIRKVLGGPGDEPYIATVPRRGYRFVVEVRESGRLVQPVAQPSVAPGPAAGPLRLAVPLDGLSLALGSSGVLAISPDGSRIVFAAEVDGVPSLMQRRLNQFATTEIAGTKGATNPFFSPDGEWIGFQSGRRLCKVALEGGPPVVLCDAADVRGAAWSPSGVIIFAPGPTSGLWRVDETGGVAAPLTQVHFDGGERTHRWPHPLPDGRGVIFTVGHAGAASFDEGSLAVVELDGGGHQLIVRHATDGRYLASGHLVWARGSALLAARFDPGARRIIAAARHVQNGVAMTATGAAHFAVASSGTLVHVPGEAQTLRRSLVAVDAAGRITGSYLRAEALEEPRLAPGGGSVVVSLRARSSDLWLYEFARGAARRLTFAGENFAGVWGPGPGELTFSSSREGGPSELYVVQPDRPDTPALLVTSEFDKVPGTWTRDGSALVFTEYHPETGADIWVLEPAAERTRPFIRTVFNEYAPAFSPDARYVAYTTDESGRPEIQLMDYPEAAAKRQLSTDGGTEPIWSADGQELFYRSGDRLMRVDMSRGPDDAGIPTTMFEGRYAAGTVTLANYDVLGEGAGFLMVQPDVPPRATALHVTLGWFHDLS